ncbi:hypothetical protein CL632_03730 [bacterium]|jgi:hypothetical protein|nr:hypothetical protein [bacterium]MDP6756380.1 hypothetical protein [Patescibacteria group bacterium]|tara:strand:- start:5256 stop:5693 length:438 start_codon:yes stop_codon:yes gene_type:complete
MNLKPKTGIIISTIGVLLWSALFALFYTSDQDYGKYPEIEAGSVRGESVKRFQLNNNDVLMISRRASGNYEKDVLLLIKKKEIDEFTIYIVRNQEQLVFEQTISSQYNEVLFNGDFARFEIGSNNSSDVFWLIPEKNTYILSASE